MAAFLLKSNTVSVGRTLYLAASSGWLSAWLYPATMSLLPIIKNDTFNDNLLKDGAFAVKEITFYELYNNANEFQVGT